MQQDSGKDMSEFFSTMIYHTFCGDAGLNVYWALSKEVLWSENRSKARKA